MKKTKLYIINKKINNLIEMLSQSFIRTEQRMLMRNELKELQKEVKELSKGKDK